MSARWAAIAAAAAASLVAAAPAGAADRCSLPGARTLRENARARLFAVARPHRDRSPLFYGCLRGARPRLLAADVHSRSEFVPSESNSKFALGGTTVAWLYQRRDTEDYSREIRTRSLARRRPTLVIPTWDEGLAEDENHGDVLDLAVGDGGEVAWAIRTPAQGLARVEIDGVAPRATRFTPVAVVETVERGSLRVGGGSVRWRSGGQTLSAPLRAPVPLPRGNTAGQQGLDGRFGTCGALVPIGGPADAIATAPGGAVVVAGANGRDALSVERILGSGGPDPGFGGSGAVRTTVPQPAGSTGFALSAVVVGPDGRVLVAGNSTVARRSNVPVLVRYTADGGLDTAFGSGGVVQPAIPFRQSARIDDVALAPDGGVIVAATRDGGFALARLRSDGVLDASFGGGGVAPAPVEGAAASAVTVAADGTIAVAGSAGDRPLLARFTAAGAALGAATEGPPAIAALREVAALPGGGYAAAGAADDLEALDQLVAARYDAQGMPDPAFGHDGFALDPEIGGAQSLAMAGDGSWLIAADFNTTGHDVRAFASGLVRLRPDGRRDAGFGFRGALGGSGFSEVWVNDAVPGPDGTAYAAEERTVRGKDPADHIHVGAVARFAISAPATDDTRAEPAICRISGSAQRDVLLDEHELDVGLKLRTPGRVVVTGTVTAGGRSAPLRRLDVVRSTIEGFSARVELTRAAVALVRAHRHPVIHVRARRPGRPAVAATVPVR